MTLRNRIGAAAGIAVAGVVVAVAIAVYVADRSELRGQIDKSLADVARPYESGRPGPTGGPDRDDRHGLPPRLGRPTSAPPAPFGGASGYVQEIEPDGTVLRPPSETSALPVD